MSYRHTNELRCRISLHTAPNQKFFSYNDQFYEQISGAVMDFFISPVIANIFMEHFEKEASERRQKSQMSVLLRIRRYVCDLETRS